LSVSNQTPNTARYRERDGYTINPKRIGRGARWADDENASRSAKRRAVRGSTTCSSRPARDLPLISGDGSNATTRQRPSGGYGDRTGQGNSSGPLRDSGRAVTNVHVNVTAQVPLRRRSHGRESPHSANPSQWTEKARITRITRIKRWDYTDREPIARSPATCFLAASRTELQVPRRHDCFPCNPCP